MGRELKTIGFAAIVCVVCSLLLSGTYSSLRERQESNKLVDLKMKVLQTFGVRVTDDHGRRLMTDAEIIAYFKERVQGAVLDSEGRLTDRRVEDLTPDEINLRDRSRNNLKAFYPFYRYTTDDGETLYAIHISGMGLWSIVKGYLALHDDFATVAGVAFYDHAETPGLGGDIDKPAFQNQFKGKALARNGEPSMFRVLRPGEPLDDASVHGPSGSTMTSKGITAFVNSDFAVYNAYFKSLAEQG